MLDHLDWWPPLTPMTPDQALALVAALKPHAHRAVAAAQAYLADVYPGIAPKPYAVPARHLVGDSIAPNMKGACIGVVSVRTPSASVVVVRIAVTREGSLAIAVPDGRLLKWIAVE